MGNTKNAEVMDYYRPKYPAGIDDQWVISVGGSNQQSYHVNSIRGTSTDILAPFANHSIGVDDSSGTKYYFPVIHVNGTSFSTPQASGIAALLLAYRDTLSGQGIPVPQYLAPEDIVMLMAEGVSVEGVIPRMDGYALDKSSDLGYGIVHAENALARLNSPYNLEHITLELEIDEVNFVLDTIPIAFPTKYRAFSLFQDDLYEVRKYHVIVNNVPFPDTYPHIKRAWNRGARTRGAYPNVRRIEVKTTTGGNYIEERLPLYRNAGWAKTPEFNSTSCKIETYVYQYRLYASGGQWKWLDIDPVENKIYVALSILSDSNYTVSNDFIQPHSFRVSNVYPNPVSAQATAFYVDIQSTVPQKVQVYMFDALGRAVWLQTSTLTLNQGMNTIHLKNNALAKGMYYIHIANETITKTCKLVVIE
jgi:Secretion system C-terminal sorting domain/Subtilase family